MRTTRLAVVARQTRPPRARKTGSSRYGEVEFSHAAALRQSAPAHPGCVRCIFRPNVSIDATAVPSSNPAEAMTIWLFALLLTAIACATLYYAGAGRRVNAGATVADATDRAFPSAAAGHRSRRGDGAAGRGRSGCGQGRTGARSDAPQGRRGDQGQRGRLRFGCRWCWSRRSRSAPMPGSADPTCRRRRWRAATPRPKANDARDAIETIEARLAADAGRSARLDGDCAGLHAAWPLRRCGEGAAPGQRAGGTDGRHARPISREALMMQKDGSVEGEPLELLRRAYDARPDACPLALLHRGRGNAGRRLRGGDPRLERASEAVEGRRALGGDGAERAGLRRSRGSTRMPASAEPDQAQIDAMVDGLERG